MERAMSKEMQDGGVFHHPYEINESVGNLKLSISHNDLVKEAGIKKWRSNWHIHSECEIIAVIKGCECVIADRDYDLRAGDVLVVPRRVNHRCVPVDDVQTKISLLVSVSAKRSDLKLGKVELHLFDMLNNLLNRSFAPIHMSARSDLVRYVDDAVAIAGSSEKMSKMIFKYQLITFVLRTLDALGDMCGRSFDGVDGETRMLGSESSNVRDQLIERYLYGTDYDELSVKGLAEYIHLSERQTSRILIEHFGATFKQVVNQRRIKTAQTLLCEGVPLNKVAETVGFSSINGFNKAFKNVVGVSPYQFLKEIEVHRDLSGEKNSDAGIDDGADALDNANSDDGGSHKN